VTPLPQVNEVGQQPVGEDQLVLHPSHHHPAPRAQRKQGLVPLVARCQTQRGQRRGPGTAPISSAQITE
jgi:hypothetical protein